MKISQGCRNGEKLALRKLTGCYNILKGRNEVWRAGRTWILDAIPRRPEGCLDCWGGEKNLKISVTLRLKEWMETLSRLNMNK